MTLTIIALLISIAYTIALCLAAACVARPGWRRRHTLAGIAGTKRKEVNSRVQGLVYHNRRRSRQSFNHRAHRFGRYLTVNNAIR